MNGIEIIGAPFSSYVWVVRMALEEKGVPYHLVPAPMHSPEVSAIHPFGKIPVMRHGDLLLCESKAITTYIDKTFSGPKLIPDDARGTAEVEQWVSLVNTMIDPCLIRTYLFAYLIPRGAGGQPDRAAIDAVLPAMQQQIHVLDRAVASTGYLAGASFSLADIYLLPVLHLCPARPRGRRHGAVGQEPFGVFRNARQAPKLPGIASATADGRVGGGNSESRIGKARRRHQCQGPKPRGLTRRLRRYRLPIELAAAQGMPDDAPPRRAGRSWAWDPYGFFRQRPMVGVVPHFAPSGAPPAGQKTDANVSLASQLTAPSACTNRTTVPASPLSPFSPFAPGAPCGPCGPCGPDCP
jgi:glutathione S-transferase